MTLKEQKSSAEKFPPVIILCGGLGTRLGKLAESVPKALVEVAGRPFIEHQIRLLCRQGVKRLVICSGHHGVQIERFVQDGSTWGMNVQYSRDGAQLLGTGGAVKKAAKLLDSPFAVMYGDTFLDIDFAPVYARFLAAGCAGLITVLANDHRWDTSNLLFLDGVVCDYQKGGADARMQHIDYGLSLFRPTVFDRYTPDTVFDLGEVFMDLIRQGQLAGFEVSKRFYEIGTPEALAETERYLQTTSP